MKKNYKIVLVIFIGFFIFINCGGVPNPNPLSENWALYIAKNPGGEDKKQAKSAVTQSKKLYSKGKRLHKSRRYAAAIKKYEAALKLHATGDLYYGYANSLAHISLKKSVIAYKIALKLKPSKKPYVLYNLACVYSRLSMAEEGFTYLKKAFHAGYSSVGWISRDGDLKFLRKQKEWKKVYAECNNIYTLSMLKFVLIASKTAYKVSAGVDYESLLPTGRVGFNIRHLVIPAEYQGKPVTAIKGGVYLFISQNSSFREDGPFCDCPSLVSVKIPNSITTIGMRAFYRCYNLVNINIPNSVTTIGESAFDDCKSLTSIKIPNSVTRIGDYAFSNCHSLVNIKIPNNVTKIGKMAFAYCSSLVSIKIPDSVTKIGEQSFYDCSSLVSIKIPYNSVSRFMKLLPSKLHPMIVGY